MFTPITSSSFNIAYVTLLQGSIQTQLWPFEHAADIGQKSCPHLYDYFWLVNEYIAMQNDGKLFYQFLDDKEDQRYKEMYEEYYEKDEVSTGEYSHNMTVAGRSGFSDNFSINDVKAFADQILALIDFDKISMIAQGKSRKRRQEEIAEDMQEYNVGDHGDRDEYKKGRHGHKQGHKGHKKVYYERRKHGNIPFGYCPSTLLSMDYKINESCGKEIFDASQRWTAGCTEDIDEVKQCLGFHGK